jgi:hypothetical protein
MGASDIGGDYETAQTLQSVLPMELRVGCIRSVCEMACEIVPKANNTSDFQLNPTWTEYRRAARL